MWASVVHVAIISVKPTREWFVFDLQVQQTERTFTEPRAPRKEESTPGLLEKYKTELGIYHKDRKEYKDNKSKVFVVILGQCLPSVRSKLESDDGYSTLENNDDVVGLLKELRKMAFLTVLNLHKLLLRVY
jgi:hypothetical protein